MPTAKTSTRKVAKKTTGKASRRVIGPTWEPNDASKKAIQEAETGKGLTKCDSLADMWAKIDGNA